VRRDITTSFGDASGVAEVADGYASQLAKASGSPDDRITLTLNVGV